MKRFLFPFLLVTSQALAAEPLQIDGNVTIAAIENQLRSVTHEWAIDEGKIAALQAQVKVLTEELAKAKEKPADAKP